MLQKIRDRITGGYAIAFLALLAVPFAFFGVSSPFSGDSWAAKVNGVEISANRFQNAFLGELQRFSEQGTDIPPNLRPLVRQGVLSNLIRETLVDLHTADSGYRIDDRTVAEIIRGAPDFQEDGSFSRDVYRQWLDLRGLTPTQFEENQRRSLRAQQFQRATAGTAFVTPGEFRRYLNLYAEQRRAAVATFDVAAIAEEVTVDDAEIASWYEEHASDFRSPESVDVQYIELDRREVAAGIQIDEERLREYYEQSADRYLRDERRRARHILIPFGDELDAAREQAEALAARAEAGEPFEDLARQYSADSGTSGDGGDLGLTMRSQLPDALAGVVFSMSPGEIAGPIESRFGFHVVRLDETEAGGPLPLDEVRGELLAELRDIEAENAWQDLERAVLDALFDGDDIGQIAERLGLELRSAEGITRQGAEPFGGNQSVIDTVFDPMLLAADGTVSDLVELDANRSAVFSVSEYREAAQLPLDEVREEIVATLRDERAREIARERATALEDALRAGADFAEAAAQAGADAAPPALIGRQDNRFDPRVRQEIFRATKPRAEGAATVGSVLAADGNIAVFSLQAVVPGRPESIPQDERDAGKRQLEEQAGIFDYTATILQLERQADINIAEEALSVPDF